MGSEEESYWEYVENANANAELFKDLKEEGWNTRLYTSEKYIKGVPASLVNNARENQEYVIKSKPEFAGKLYQLSFFYISPQFFKEKLFFYSGDFAKLCGLEDSRYEAYDIVNEPLFYQEFEKQSLKATKEENVFVLYHLFGIHGPYTINENVEYVEKGTSRKKQILGCMRILQEYFDEMKKLGLYDTSTIIITGDHGGRELFQNPAVLIKRPYEKDINTKNDAPLTFNNLYNTFLSLTVGKNVGEDMYADVDNEYRVHVAHQILENDIFGDNTKGYNTYLIPRYARDFDNIILKDSRYKKYKYELGEKILFANNQNEITMYAVKGVSGAEPNYVWTDGKEAVFRFETGKEISSDLELKLEHNGCFEGQTVTVIVNESEIEKFFVTEAGTLDVVIPNEYVKDGNIELKLLLPDAHKPNIGVDPEKLRELGIAIVSVEIKERE